MLRSLETGVWSFVVNPDGLPLTAFSNTASPTSDFTGTAGESYTLRWTLTNGVCAVSSDEVTITIDADPTVANAGTDQTGVSAVCGTSTALTGNSATTGNGLWSIVTGDGNGAFVDATSPTTLFTGSEEFTYTLRWTISNGVCVASTSDVAIEFDADPTVANAGLDQQVCGSTGLPVSLSANAPVFTGETGVWSFVVNPDGLPLTAFSNTASPTSDFTGTAGESYTLRWTLTNGVCAVSSDEVTITIDADPTVANAGTDQTGVSAVCGTSTALTGNSATTGNGLWSIVTGDGNGAFVDATSPTTLFTGSEEFTYTLRWTISNGVCVASTSDVAIEFDADPTVANAGLDQQVCGSTGLPVSLSANAPVFTGETGVWSFVVNPDGLPLTAFSNTASPTSDFTGTAGESYTLRWTLTNGVCAVSSDEVTITIDADPTVANAGTDQTGVSAVCGTSTALTGNSATTGNGLWSIVTGDGNGAFVDATSPTTLFTGSEEFTYTLRWTISNGVCVASTSDVAIEFDADPTVANAGLDQQVCGSTGLPVSLSANAPVFTGETGVWSFVVNPDGLPLTAFSNTASPTSDFTGTAGESYTLRWTLTNGVCAVSSDEVTITIDADPTVANAGTDQTGVSAVCGTSTALTGNSATTGNGLWSIVTGDGNGAFVDATSPTTLFTGSEEFTYTLRWTISNGVCVASTSDVAIEFDADPTVANAGLDQQVCGSTGLPVSLSANAPVFTGETGVWSFVVNPDGLPLTAFSNTASPTSDFTGTAGESYTLRWTLTNGVCAVSSDEVTITIDADPTVANAGTDQTGVSAVCGTSTALTGNSATTGNGLWSIVTGDGNGAFVDATSPTTLFTGSEEFTYTLRWTISNGVCVASTSDVAIEFDADPTVANAGLDQQVCGSTGLPVSLSANAPVFTGETGVWSFVVNPDGLPLTAFSNTASPTSDFTGTAGESYTLRWTLTNGVCAVSSDEVTITIDADPTVANAGTDQTGVSAVCGTSTALTGNSATTGNGLWSIVTGDGNGAFVDATSPTTLFTGSEEFTYTLRWTISNGVCVASTSDVAIEFDADPTVANAGLDQQVCGSTGLPVSLSANAPVFTGETGVWSFVVNPDGLPLTAFSNTASPTSDFTGTAGESYTLRWTLTNGVCAVSSDEVTITIDADPTVANAGTDQTGVSAVCGTSTALTGNSATTGNGLWSIVTGDGNGAFVDATSPTTLFTGSEEFTYTLRWTISNGVCVASTSDVAIEFDADPTVANAGLDQQVCGSTGLPVSLSANAPVFTGETGVWSFVVNPDGLPLTAFSNTASPTSDFTGTAGESYTLRWTLTNGVCAVSSDEVTITIDADPTVANAGTDQTGVSAVCGTSTALTGNSATTGNGLWSIVTGDGNGAFVDATSPTTLFTGSEEFTYTLRWTISNGVCVASTSDVAIEFDADPTVANAGLDQQVCGSTGLPVSLSANAPVFTGETGVWSFVVNPDGLPLTAFSNTASPTSDFTGTAGESYTLRWTLTNGVCAVSSDEVTITIDADPTVANAGTDQTGVSAVCGTSTALTGNSATTGNGLWSIVTGDGNGAFVDATSPTTLFTGSEEFTYTLRWTISNGVCVASTSDVAIEFDADPTVANAGLDQQVCGSTGLPVSLSANAPVFTGETGVWSFVVNPDGLPLTAFSNTASPTSDFTGTAGESYTLRWTLTNGVCAVSSDEVTITIDADPTVANAGTDQTGVSAVCGTSTALTGNSATTGNGLWSIVTGDGNGAFVDATSPTTLFTGSEEFTYTLRWTISNGVCVASTSDVAIEFDADPTVANAGLDQQVCGSTGLPVSLSANAPVFTGETGVWSFVVNPDGLPLTAFSNTASPTSDFTGTAGESYTLRWTLTNGVCAVSSDEVTITIDADPTVANAGTDQTGVSAVCGTSTALTGNSATTGNGLWSIVTGDGNGAFVDATSPTTLFTGSEEFTYTLRWTISNGVCVASTSDVAIEFDADPTVANAGLDQQVCGSTGLPVSLSANAPVFTGETGVWSFVVNPDGLPLTAFSNTASPTSDFTGTAGESYTLRWTLTNGVCAVSSDEVTITIDADPTVANAGTDQTGVSAVCGTSTALTGNSATTGNGLWSIVTGDGNGAFVDATSPTTLFTGSEEFTYTLRWTISNGVCVASTSDVAIEFDADPTVANAGLDQTQCNDGNFTLSGNDVSALPGDGTWSIVGAANGASITPGEENDFDATVAGLLPGNSVTLRWTISTGSSCPNSFDDVTLTNITNPTVVTPADQELCANDMTTSISFSGTGAQYNWVNDTPSIGLPASGSGDVASFTAINNTGSPVVATISITPVTGPCVGTVQDFTITVNPNPVLTISNLATEICSGELTDITLTTPTDNEVITVTDVNYGLVTGGSVSVSDVYSDGGEVDELLENPTDNAITISYEFTITTTDGCPTAPTAQTVFVTVAPRPTMSISNSTATDICSGEATAITLNSTVTDARIVLEGVSNTTGVTGFTSVGVTFMDGDVIADNLVNTTNSPITITYAFSVNVDGCDDGVVDMTTDVTVNPNPVLTITNAATEICSGELTDITLTTPTDNEVITVTDVNYGLVTGGSVSVSDVYSDGGEVDELLENPTDNAITISYEFTITTTDGCPTAPTAQTVFVTVAPRPTMSISNSTATDICSGEATAITLNSTVTDARIVLEGVSNTTGVTGFTSAGVTFIDGDVIADNLVNTTNSPITITYAFSVNVDGCDDGVVDMTTDVTVNPNPVLTITNAATEICSGELTDITLTTPTDNEVITVTDVNYGLVTGGSVSVSDVYSDGGEVDELLENPTDNAITISYEFTITTTDGCPTAPTAQTVFVTVAPRPTMSISNSTATDICSGEATAITLNSTVTDARIVLEGVSNTTGVTGFTSAGVTFIDGDVIADNLVNTTNSPITITYAFSVNVDGCDDGVVDMTTDVTVNPNPVLTISNLATEICSGELTDITLTTPTDNEVITVTDVNYGLVTGGSVSVSDVYSDGGEVDELLENPTDNAITISYEFTITTTDGCPTAPTAQTVFVTVAPRPTMSISNSTATDICSGEATAITLNSTVTDARIVLEGVSNTTGVTGFTSVGVTFMDGDVIADNLVNTTNSPITITYAFSVNVDGCDDGVVDMTTDVTVNPNPVLTITNAATEICSGELTDITLTTPTDNEVITVTDVNYGLVTGGSVSVSDVYSDGGEVDELLENPTDNAITISYEFTITTTDGCPTAPTAQTVFVTVAPRPTMSISNSTATGICSGEATAITLNSTVTDARIVLEGVSNTTGVTGFTSAGVTFIDGDVIADNLVNTTNSPITITYAFSVNVDGCDDGVVDMTTDVTVNPNPVLTITNAATEICSGELTDITLTTPTDNEVITVTDVNYGLVTGGSVSVSDVYSDGGEVDELLENPTDNAITISYEFTITTTDGCPTAPTAQTVFVTVAPRPTMSISNSTATGICSGEATAITLNSTVTDARIVLEGVSNTTGVTGFTSAGVTFIDGDVIADNLVNTTNSPITITYAFSVNVDGCDDGVVDMTTDVTVNPNPVLTITNAATEICSGELTDITLTTPTDNEVITVTDVNYGLVTGGSVSVSDVYSDGGEVDELLENPTDNAITISYEFTITTTDGCPTAPTAQTVFVTVAPRPTMSISNSTATDICSGEATAITLNSTVTDARIVLEGVSNTTGVTGFTSAGVTFIDGDVIADNLVNTTNSPITITYAFSVNVDGCDDGVVDMTTDVTVNPNPTFTAVSNLDQICSGEQVDIDLFSPTLNAEINLLSVNYGAASGTLSSGTYSTGDNISEILTNVITAPVDVIYEFNVTSTDGCPVFTPPTQTITVTVSPEPNFTITNNASVICSEESADIDIFSTTTGAVIEIISVNASDPSIVGVQPVGATFLSGSKISNQLSHPLNTTQTVEYQFDVTVNGCINPTIITETITINPIPTIDTSVDAQTICDGETTNIELFNPNNVSGTTYTWTATPSGGILNASGGTLGPGAGPFVIAQTLANPTNMVGTVTYNITPSAGGCDGNSKTIIVTVNPTPTLSTTGAETLCSGETTNIVLTNDNGVSGTTFSWTVINNVNGVFGADPGSGSSINQTLQVSNNSPAGSVTYRITPTANGCNGVFQDVIVNVNPLPGVFAGFDYEICEDEPSIILTASLSGSATSGTWTGGNNPSGFSNNPVVDGEAIEYAFNQTDIDNSPITFTLTTDDPDGIGPCTAVSDEITITINLLPGVTLIGLPDSIAENAPPVALVGTPIGGIFSGDGISGSSFNPAGGTVGVQNFVTYTFTNPMTGCTNSVTDSTFINGTTPIDLENAIVQICFADDPDELQANPSGGTWTGTGVLNTGGTDYIFDPSQAGVGTFILTYSFTNTSGATSTADLTYEVLPLPQVDFTNDSFCFDDDIQFTDLSTIDNSVFASAAITEWNWTFFDENDVIVGASISQNPLIRFNTPGAKRVILDVVSETNGEVCNVSIERLITVGSVPDTRFEWQSVCNGDFTAFLDDTILEVGSVDNYEWDFDDGNAISGSGDDNATITHSDGSETQGIFRNPEHRYVSVGSYDVTLTVTTNEGCVRTYEQNIDILPQTTIADFPYTANFDANNENWAEEVELVRDTALVSDNSWRYSTGGNGEILPKYSGDGFWWTGGNGGSYFNDEQSWVNGPCFDFSGIDRPMISMKIISSTDNGFDGAVLQYSIDGAATWENVGALDQGGINWYNSNAISAQPGDQDFGFGWTGEIERSDEGSLQWIEVAHNLNNLKGEDNVLLRVAFGSNGDNSGNVVDGFAFDDVFVGNKERLVLLEHFTDTDRVSARDADVYLNSLADAQQTSFDTVDFTTIRYHINDSGNDPFNEDNPGDPSARGLYYGIAQAPSTVMDGLKGTFSGNPFGLTVQEIDQRSLLKPLFDINIDTLSQSLETMVVEVEFTAREAINDVVTLQIGVVEDLVELDGQVYTNVLKRLLLGGEGRSINRSWSEGQSETVRYEWEIDVEIFNPANLYVIGYVQNKESREIYGAAQIKAQNQDESVITGIGEEVFEQAKTISIYPNPARDIVNFKLSDLAMDDYSWKIVDQRGIAVKEGAIDFNSTGVYSVNTTDLINGVYYVVIASQDKPLVYRKLAIMNRK